MRTAFFIRASLVSNPRRTDVRNRSVLRLENSERGKFYRVEMLLCEIRRKVNREFWYVSARTGGARAGIIPGKQKKQSRRRTRNRTEGRPHPSDARARVALIKYRGARPA